MRGCAEDNAGQWSPHRRELVAPFKNATSREFRILPPAEAGGFQFAGIAGKRTYYSITMETFVVFLGTADGACGCGSRFGYGIIRKINGALPGFSLTKNRGSGKFFEHIQIS
jgi:hypothetical protein